jgi:hypothetical protein
LVQVVVVFEGVSQSGSKVVDAALPVRVKAPRSQTINLPFASAASFPVSVKAPTVAGIDPPVRKVPDVVKVWTV